MGEFREPEFRDKFFAGALPADCYYWHQGMEDWRPISEYRALAKTQKISFAPPIRPTVRINVDSVSASASKPDKSQNLFVRLWNRLTKKQNK